MAPPVAVSLFAAVPANLGATSADTGTGISRVADEKAWRRGGLLGWLALACALAVGGLASSPAAARVHRDVARAAGVRAVLRSVVARDQYGYREIGRTHLTISRHGRVVVSKPLMLGQGCHCAALPAYAYRHHHSVAVRSVDHDRAPEVVVDLYTRGAHCCFFTQVYDWSATRRVYRKVVAHWGNAGDRLIDLDHDGRSEFVSGDDRFAYAFASYAESRFPLRVLEFAGGRFHAVTRRFPEAIRRDARRCMTLYYDASPRADVRGILAAYAADKVLLGEAPEAFEFLDEVAGDIDGPGPPTGRAYMRQLKRFLRKLGYLS